MIQLGPEILIAVSIVLLEVKHLQKSHG